MNEKDFKALILLNDLNGIDQRIRNRICEGVIDDNELKVLNDEDLAAVNKIIEESKCSNKDVK